MQSKKYTLNKEDGVRILRGATYALIGALVTYLTATVASTDFGTYTPMVVAFWSIVASTVNKLVTGR